MPKVPSHETQIIEVHIAIPVQIPVTITCPEHRDEPRDIENIHAFVSIDITLQSMKAESVEAVEECIVVLQDSVDCTWMENPASPEAKLIITEGAGEQGRIPSAAALQVRHATGASQMVHSRQEVTRNPMRVYVPL